MAAARERNERNLFEDGGGFGKFRKRPFRRSQATPYDRPPTAMRTSGHVSSSGGGWLSKLVDPAQRLIAYGAHKLFASVFRKRLPPPPPPPRQPEANQGAMDLRQETVLADSPGSRVAAANRCIMLGGSSEKEGVTELELVLKQKTFTRSEIERLTTLLQSRTVDLHVLDEENRSEAVPTKAVLHDDQKEKFPITPIRENGIESHLISTPAISSSVLNEVVASPAELAKAYMGSRSSKVSPSMPGSCSQFLRKESAALMNNPFASTSPIKPVVPKSSGHGSFHDNGFVTPRSRGRSAIYSMARTPYSRVHSTTMSQDYGKIYAFGGPSTASKNAWDQENNTISESKQGALKRRSFVLDNDLESAGPIRRIRQKANLLPASGILFKKGTGFGSDAAAQHPSSSKKPGLVGEPLKENGNNNLHGSGFTAVPSKSSEMASKILQQLDVLVSSKEKLPAKLSPSMLRGPALRSLEKVDSSKLLEIVQDTNRSGVKHDISLTDAQDTVSKKQDKIEDNGTTKFITYEKSDSAINSADAANLLRNNVTDVKTTVINSVVQPLSQKKQAFRMSALEDYVELDDDDYSNATRSTTLNLEDKAGMTSEKGKNSADEVITVEKPPTFSEINYTEGSMVNQKTMGNVDVSLAAERSSGFTFPNATLSGAAVPQQAVVNIWSTVKPDEAAETKKLNAASPKFSSGEMLVSLKEPNSAALTSDFGHKTSEKISPFTWVSPKPAVSDSAGLKLAAASNLKTENSSSVASVPIGASKSKITESEADRADDKNSMKPGVFLRSPENVSPAVSMLAPTAKSIFGSPANSLPLTSASLLSTPVSFSSPSPLISNNVPSQNLSGSSINAFSDSIIATPTIVTTTDTTNGSSLSITASTTSIMATPIFSFGSSAPLTSSSLGVQLTEAETKETITANVSTSAFVGTSSAMTSTGSSLSSGTCVAGTGSPFGGSSAIITLNAGTTTSLATDPSRGFDSSTLAIVQAPAAGTGFVTSTQTTPFQFASSTSSSFESAGSAAFSSGGSQFSSSTAKSLSPGATFGLTSSTSSDANAVSSSSSTTAMLGSSLQTPRASIFGSTISSSLSSSSGFTFSNTATSSTPLVFGSSTNASGPSLTSNATTSGTTMDLGSSATASSSSIFSFSSPAVSTPPQPVFGNPNPSFAFGVSASPGNNDQMNMEDSMAEDTAQANMPTVPVFSQPPNTLPSSGFVFGSSASSGANPFGATAPSGANPFGATAPSGANLFGATAPSVAPSVANPFGATSPSVANPFGATAPSGANPFQFASQPNMASQFQASGNLEFNAGGSSFSLGSGGGDKSGRKFVKVRKSQRKK